MAVAGGWKRVWSVATLDVRHFGTVSLPTSPRLIPRDLP
jgi:hypothetical protein